jgi:hypothetical protein
MWFANQLFNKGTLTEHHDKTAVHNKMAYYTNNNAARTNSGGGIPHS